GKALPHIEAHSAHVCFLDLQANLVGVGKATLDLVEQQATDTPALMGRMNVELMELDGLAVISSGRERHACNRLAVIGEQELGLWHVDALSQRAQRMPVAVDRRDPVRTVDRVVGVAPGLNEQLAHRLEIAFRSGADKHGYSIPRRALTRSLTACGFALPPVAFITWPTNQPASVGLALACSALSGLAAMTSSTAFSIAPVSVTCFMPRVSTTSRGSPPSFQMISNRSLAILPEIVPSLIRSTM